MPGVFATMNETPVMPTKLSSMKKASNAVYITGSTLWTYMPGSKSTYRRTYGLSPANAGMATASTRAATSKLFIRDASL